jgi:hypothetical protein
MMAEETGSSCDKIRDGDWTNADDEDDEDDSEIETEIVEEGECEKRDEELVESDRVHEDEWRTSTRGVGTSVAALDRAGVVVGVGRGVGFVSISIGCE